MTTAIFDSNDFSSNTVDIPNGESTITGTGSINIILSTGVNQPVFNSLSTALKCLNFMNSRNQYFIMANDDITIINCQTNFLIFSHDFTLVNIENTFYSCANSLRWCPCKHCPHNIQRKVKLTISRKT